MVTTTFFQFGFEIVSLLFAGRREGVLLLRERILRLFRDPDHVGGASARAFCAVRVANDALLLDRVVGTDVTISDLTLGGTVLVAQNVFVTLLTHAEFAAFVLDGVARADSDAFALFASFLSACHTHKSNIGIKDSSLHFNGFLLSKEKRIDERV
jgi:hypothetical protein